MLILLLLCRRMTAVNFVLDPGRIPRTYAQVFLLQLPAKPALDAARAQEQVEDVPKEWKQKGLPGGAGDGNGAWPDDGRPEFVVDAWPAPRLPAAVVACGGAPGHDDNQSRRNDSNFSREFHSHRNSLRFFLSAALMCEQRSQASGSIRLLISFSTHSRSMLGSIASSSQHWLP